MKLARKVLALVLALSMVLCLAACGGSKHEDGEINVCLASEPDTLDPALNSTVDGASLAVHLFSGLAKWAQNEDGELEVVADAATELTEPVKNDDGSVTYTYTLRDGLKWSNGKDVTAEDFVYSWNRAASPELAADYNYMFEVVKGYATMWDTDDAGNVKNPDAKLAVEATDAKTLKVTLSSNISYWNQLIAFPAYFPVYKDAVADESWATDPSTYVCNGPYTMSAWDHNSVITLTKNPDYYDADSITMDTINFYLSDDNSNMLSNFQNGDWQLIDDVPTNEISTLKEEDPDEFTVAGQIGTYYVCWNINEDLLPDFKGTTAEKQAAQAEVRNAIGLLLDRNYICENIAQGGEVPASSFVAMGMVNTDGTEFYKTAGNSKDYVGYYDVSADATTSNFNSAVETLKKYYNYDESTQKFTNFPTLTYLYNTSDSHKAIAEYLQSALSQVGINLSLENQEWNTFLNSRKNGDFSIARNGWIADYQDPICFLDLWTTNSGNNDIQYGKGDNANLAIYSLDLTSYGYDVKVENGTWAQTYDVLISTIKACEDAETRNKLMHYAEDILMSTGCICPLYYYTDIYMLDSSVQGFYSSPLGYKYFMYCTYAD